MAAAPTLDVTLPDGSRRTGEALLSPWVDRAKQARKARRPFEKQWMLNQSFAAGKQWVKYQSREHRVIDDVGRRRQGRSMQEANMLTQYLWTAIGKLAADDFRPELLFTQDNEEAEEYAKQANLAFGWGWDEEWRGDQILLDLLQTLAVYGTGAVRCRYDRTKGAPIGDVPHAHEGGYTHTDQQTGQQTQYDAGKPILDPAHARTYVADRKYYGDPIDMRPLREGQCAWEVLSPWNLLPQPGVEHERDTTWEIIVRPVALETLKELYGDRAADVPGEEIEAMSLLGMKELTAANAGFTLDGGSVAKLEDHALVYTGYQKPNADFPKGQRIVWAGENNLLDVAASLPLTGDPYGPRSGITYFRYWPVKQRFFGMALIEPGIGPQRRRNKRSSQVDEIIDRGLPKVYAEEGSIDVDRLTGTPLEVVELKTGASKPMPDGGVAVGPWMTGDIEQCDNDIQKALGINDIGLGNAPTGVSAYSAMALISENDAQKLNPIAQRFKLGVADLGRDTLELMKNWPDGKQLLIAGDDDRLQAIIFSRATLPACYYVRPAKGGTLPRSQASEIQKVADLWNAATVAGVVAQAPQAWIEWYKTSLDEGTADELPRMDQTNEQRHKAALENIVMVQTGQPVPVAPYDDPQVHIPEHDEELMQLQSSQEMGDTGVAAAIQAIDIHKQMHLAQAQQTAAAGPVPPGSGPTVTSADGGDAPFLPPPQYENTLQTPRLPRAGNNFGFR